LITNFWTDRSANGSQKSVAQTEPLLKRTGGVTTPAPDVSSWASASGEGAAAKGLRQGALSRSCGGGSGGALPLLHSLPLAAAAAAVVARLPRRAGGRSGAPRTPRRDAGWDCRAAGSSEGTRWKSRA